MRFAIILLYFLINLTGLAQERTLILVDKNDRSPVILAHVIAESYQTISDVDGRIEIPERIVDEQIRITNVGYEDFLFVPSKTKSDTILLRESKTLLNPVVITGGSVSDLLFTAVENTAKRMQNQPPLRADYWNTIIENDAIKGFKIASLIHSNNKSVLDTTIAATNCSDYEMESFTNANLIWEQNHVNPALSCLKRTNEEFWNYALTNAYDHSNYTEAKIEARFISPAKKVDHTFEIWLNVEEEIISRIKFQYIWYVDQRKKIEGRYGKYYNLNQMSGQVIFSDTHPIVINTTYSYSICDLNSEIPCVDHTLYHELKSKSLSIESINSTLYTQLDNELKCE